MRGWDRELLSFLTVKEHAGKAPLRSHWTVARPPIGGRTHWRGGPRRRHRPSPFAHWWLLHLSRCGMSVGESEEGKWGLGLT
jgi:hypothetical protein